MEEGGMVLSSHSLVTKGGQGLWRMRPVLQEVQTGEKIIMGEPSPRPRWIQSHWPVARLLLGTQQVVLARSLSGPLFSSRKEAKARTEFPETWTLWQHEQKTPVSMP